MNSNRTSDPSVSVLDEIVDQNLEDRSGGGQGWGTTITSLSCYGVSWVLGNNGNFCTATTECQSNC
ncbi:plantaricin C family lantibiotic [Sanguibacter sp. 25GB23B1]|uniref:plantaricin C family lantibiotic n=1 Tax=unclassified Sanguibacter TaxID=2645534 RepID=UPI0032AEEE14